ncbi:MAG: hypothetical protein HYZ42_16415 [Bacteroidetes bacterium]|nr:hypothetical protein [Bacteroidota bacterium]
MILIEGQKLNCKICGKTVAKDDAIIIANTVEANEKAPLYFFNDAIFDKECFNKHSLKLKLLERLHELDKLAAKHKTDFITGENLDLKDIGHPDNLIRVFYITDDKNNLLYKYNGILLNKKNLSVWPEFEVFLNLLIELNNSVEWKGEAINYLIRQLTTPVKEPFSDEFLEKMRKQYGSKDNN